MERHLLLYDPLAEQRPEEGYLGATGDRPAIGNVGLEWMILGALLLLYCALVLNVFHIRFIFQITFVALVLAWSFVIFSYVHDGMHIKNFWTGNTPLLRSCFLKAHLRHDVHQQLNEAALMDKNFGIGLSIFDHIFRTHQPSAKPFNHRAHRAALHRYSFLRRQIEQESEIK
jgi:sterol desaturase/sphingolipid hydroxylase (fatty acid hydroxylase superfamily)